MENFDYAGWVLETKGILLKQGRMTKEFDELLRIIMLKAELHDIVGADEHKQRLEELLKEKGIILG